MQFHEKLFTLRKQFSMTQEELAEKLNVSRQAVSRWEMGTAKPEVDTLIAISDIFGVTLDYLLKDGERTVDDSPKPGVQVPPFRQFLPKRWWLPGAAAAVCKLLYMGIILLMFLPPSYYADYFAQEYFFAQTAMMPVLNALASLFFWIQVLVLGWTLLKWWKGK